MVASRKTMWRLIAILIIACLSGFSHGKTRVVQLDEDNWSDMLEGEWMVEFYAPWCPACKALQSIWEDFASWSDDLEIKVAQVDVTASPGLSGRFMVTALPTIYHILDGEFRQYRGSRDKDEFISFVEEKKWEAVEPISSWKSPSSLQMSVVSYFFKLSMVLRSIHTHLLEEYGLPNWGSYLVFGLATVIIGAMLGLILVCIIDLVYPPRTRRPEIDRKAGGESKEKNSDDEDDDQADGEEDDVIKDDSDADEGEQGGGETQSGSDTEAQESGSPDVRKRRTRKAD